ncbi:MAG TPA: hypothetical protein PLG25_06970, partial [bacterium]|nr:hypothetical protein [bacterium]
LTRFLASDKPISVRRIITEFNELKTRYDKAKNKCLYGLSGLGINRKTCRKQVFFHLTMV